MNINTEKDRKKLDLKRVNVVIEETYLDENDPKRDCERTIGVSSFSEENLIDRIDKKLKEVNPDYIIPEKNEIVENTEDKQHTVQELIDKIDEKIEKLNKQVAIDVYKEIEKLPDETEFTIQQFLEAHNIEEQDKFSICNFVFDLCKTNNIVIVEKMPDAVLGLPWNITRIKKSNNHNNK